MLRVLADANVFISYLLRSGANEGTVTRFFDALVDGAFTLLMPEDLPAEFVETVAAKPYLRKRISADQVETFVDLLTGFSEEIPRVEQPIPRVCRDPKDDYLLAYALIDEADYLVTGDKDLLMLGEIDKVKIATMAQFLEDSN